MVISSIYIVSIQSAFHIIKDQDIIHNQKRMDWDMKKGSKIERYCLLLFVCYYLFVIVCLLK